MRDWLRLRYLRFAMWVALRNRATANFGLGRNSPRNLNVIFFRMGNKNDNGMFVLDGLTPDGANGLWFSSPSAKYLKCRIANEQILAATHFDIERFRPRYQFRYGSPWHFLRSIILFSDFREMRADARDQKAFNKTTLARKTRTEVLRLFHERTIEKSDFGGGAVDILNTLYGNRWAEHPDGQRMLRRYNLILDSLVETKDLNRPSYACHLTPRGIATLSQYDEDDRQHHDNITQQRRLLWLTVVIALVAAAQAGITYWQEVNPDPPSQERTATNPG